MREFELDLCVGELSVTQPQAVGTVITPFLAAARSGGAKQP
jgi:hypothetical protein